MTNCEIQVAFAFGGLGVCNTHGVFGVKADRAFCCKGDERKTRLLDEADRLSASGDIRSANFIRETVAGLA